MPVGASLLAASTPLSKSCEGNRKLAPTATTAAANVPTKYSTKIGRILVGLPLRCCEMAEVTKANTKIGATALSAPTNRLPKIAPISTTALAAVVLRTSTPTKMPSTRPMAICVTSPKLVKKPNGLFL